MMPSRGLIRPRPRLLPTLCSRTNTLPRLQSTLSSPSASPPPPTEISRPRLYFPAISPLRHTRYDLRPFVPLLLGETERVEQRIGSKIQECLAEIDPSIGKGTTKVVVEPAVGVPSDEAREIVAKAMEREREVQGSSGGVLNAEIHLTARPKEGALFVSLPASATPYLSEIVHAIQSKPSSTPWYVTGGVEGPKEVYEVKGKPWMEDLERWPSFELKVEFVGGSEVVEEEVWEAFREYGKIVSLTLSPIKDTPRTATIHYRSVRSASTAVACLHNATLPRSPGIKMRLNYIPYLRGHAIRDWMTNHPRIVLPILVVILGYTTVLIFDPIRKLFVEAKMKRWLSQVTEWSLLKWVKRETLGRLGMTTENDDHGGLPRSGISKAREDASKKLESWLTDWPDNFIAITGPKGSGKKALVDGILKNQKHVLVLDCESLTKTTTDAQLVSELAHQIGYRPQFAFLNSMGNLMDLAAAGLIGSKPGFTTNLEEQLKQILNVTASALTSVASEAHEYQAKLEKEKAAQVSRAAQGYQQAEWVHDGRIDYVCGNGIMSDLGVGIERLDGEEDMYILGPKSANQVAFNIRHIGKTNIEESGNVYITQEELSRIPLVVLHGFIERGAADQRLDPVWDVLANWCASLVDNQVAHVIFTSDNNSISRHLSKALPDKPLDSIRLTDASPEHALEYVTSHVAVGTADVKSFDSSATNLIGKLGGRLTDLDLLVQKLKTGLSVKEAVDDIIHRNTMELTKKIFGSTLGGSFGELPKDSPWTQKQAWFLVKALATNDSLDFADTFANPPFENDRAAMTALEQIEMISIQGSGGRSVILPGKPVYRTVFERLVAHTHFSTVQEILATTRSISKTEKLIKADQDELLELGKVWSYSGSGTPYPITIRMKRLLDDLESHQKTLHNLEKKNKELLGKLKELGKGDHVKDEEKEKSSPFGVKWFTG